MSESDVYRRRILTYEDGPALKRLRSNLTFKLNFLDFTFKSAKCTYTFITVLFLRSYKSKWIDRYGIQVYPFIISSDDLKEKIYMKMLITGIL